jgi:hypothetical protein
MDVVMLAVAQMLTRASATLLVSMKTVERRALFLWIDVICRPLPLMRMVLLTLIWLRVLVPRHKKSTLRLSHGSDEMKE